MSTCRTNCSQNVENSHTGRCKLSELIPGFDSQQVGILRPCARNNLKTSKSATARADSATALESQVTCCPGKPKLSSQLHDAQSPAPIFLRWPSACNKKQFPHHDCSTPVAQKTYVSGKDNCLYIFQPLVIHTQVSFRCNATHPTLPKPQNLTQSYPACSTISLTTLPSLI